MPPSVLPSSHLSGDVVDIEMSSKVLTKEHPQAFTWSATDEPHYTRRKAILAKHPEIMKLVAREPLTFVVVFAILVSQVYMAMWMQNASWPVLLFFAYAYGGTVNHTLQLANHELSHNLCWDSVVGNKLTGIMANLATTLPSAITFQRYHMEHHQFQGVDGVDTDIPTQLEVEIFGNNTLRKIVWVFLQPLFYAIRPLMVKPKNPTMWEAFNAAAVFAFDIFIYNYVGGRGLFYLFAGTILGLGMHPTAGHFIAEHYEFIKGQETYSYYGPCNWVNFNVGYHNEHHDFPKIPWTNLPKVREIAPEFYDLPSYDSYTSVIYQYITDPNVGPFSRIKRTSRYAGSKAQSK